MSSGGGLAPPQLPPRPAQEGRDNTLESDPIDDPPPAYTPQPVAESTLAYGPSRPFQPAAAAPSPTQGFAPPSGPPPQGYPGSHSNLPPPQAPFWNGPNLTPQQTGFNPGMPMYPSHTGGSYYPPAGPPPGQNPQFAPPGGPPPLPSRTAEPTGYHPSTEPTPGQPLLNKNRLLVYPTGYSCPKCLNTGYKNYDPTHPCRKCWDKYGKPYVGALRFAPSNNGPDSNSNFQKPLRVFQPPTHSHQQPHMPGNFPGAHRPQHQPQILYGRPAPGMLGPNAVIYRPGDPRIGGRLCDTCGGDGLVVVSFFFGDEETCYRCRGTGRVFY